MLRLVVFVCDGSVGVAGGAPVCTGIYLQARSRAEAKRERADVVAPFHESTCFILAGLQYRARCNVCLLACWAHSITVVAVVYCGEWSKKKVLLLLLLGQASTAVSRSIAVLSCVCCVVFVNV